MADGASRTRTHLWFEGRLDGTLLEGRIIGCAPKVLQCPTSVKNGKTYKYISMDNIQLARGAKGQKQNKENLGPK